MLHGHQYASSVDSGMEACIHLRRCFHQAVQRDASLGVFATTDTDLENAFLSFRWSAIDASVRNHAPGLAPWSEHCHQSSSIHLPSGGQHASNRGAEQGDPDGTVQCEATMIDVRHDTTTRLQERRALSTGGRGCAALDGHFDIGFADDGQGFMRPHVVHDYLQCFDEALCTRGAQRSSGADCKSTVMLVGHPDAIAAYTHAWETPYVRDTCVVLPPNSSIEVLGTVLGSDDDVHKHFEDKCGKSGALLDKLADIDDTAVELGLARSCAGVTKLNDVLRTSGDVIARGPVALHDLQQRDFVCKTLGGAVCSDALDQASLGINATGLGFRECADRALAAFVASCVSTQALVERMCGDLDARGLPGAATYTRFQESLAQARAALLEGRSTRTIERIEGLLDAARAQSVSELAASLTAGNDGGADFLGDLLDDMTPAPPVQGVSFLHAEADEGNASSIRGSRLQQGLTHFLDQDRHQAMLARAEDEGRHDDKRRMRDLACPTVQHDWLTILDPRAPGAVHKDRFADAVRLHIGAAVAPSHAACLACGRSGTVTAGHAQCCAPGPSNAGHDALRDLTLALAVAGDANAVPEPLGLLPSAPGRRPADILTTAEGEAALFALDVNISSPESCAALRCTADFLEVARQRKCDTYAHLQDDMRQSCIVYRALPWSSYGREHPDTTATLTMLARRAARRKGWSCWKRALREFRLKASVVIQHRAVDMWRRCTMYDTRIATGLLDASQAAVAALVAAAGHSDADSNAASADATLTGAASCILGASEAAAAAPVAASVAACVGAAAAASSPGCSAAARSPA